MIIAAEPGIAEAHLILAASLRADGRMDDALYAEQEGLRASVRDPVLKQALADLEDDRPWVAERLLRPFLIDSPNDPEALRLLARVAAFAGHWDKAEQLLRQALRMAPSFTAAKRDLDKVVDGQAGAYGGITDKPPSPPEGAAEFADAIRLNEEAIARTPDDAKTWLSYGHTLRLAGHQKDSVEAYRKAVALRAAYGEAWWSLADLKTVRLDDADVAAMRRELDSSEITDDDRIGVHFALGKALGDQGRLAESFDHYAQGNSLKHGQLKFNADAIEAYVQESESAFIPEFFNSHLGWGSRAEDPIFIVGMPRSGSTLIEQILASHPSIEGTEELVYLGNLANILAEGHVAGLEESDFVAKVVGLSRTKAQNVGDAYLWNATRHRRSSRPRFTDKAPRNWLYLPLIMLALPNARIIDVRRHPLDTCWSNFRQLFADNTGFGYSYDLTELGRFYRAYVRFMDHFDHAAPGAVHRVHYEDLVANPEAIIRRLLEYLDLPFEAACLDFHTNPRAVKTSSSEQVRQPISSEAVGQWMSYEPWLAPLVEALGPIVECYPEVPSSWP